MCLNSDGSNKYTNGWQTMVEKSLKPLCFENIKKLPTQIKKHGWT